MADDFRDFVKFDGFAGQAWYHKMIRDKRILRRAREFTPERLFKSGEQGVWYDPSDTSTLFQDSAGTTPVTAAGQPVGLMLDKSKGLVLGPELAGAALFNPGTVWTATAPTLLRSNGIVSGQLEAEVIGNYAGNARVYQTLTFSANTWYTVKAEVSSSAGTTTGYGLEVFIPDGATLAQQQITGGGGRELRFYTGASTVLRVGISVNGASEVVGEKFFLRSLSVRELPGNHASQPTAASRPIYRRGDSRGVVNLLLNTETLATQSRTVKAVGHTLSFTGTGSITLSGASTAGPLVGTGVNDRVSLTFTPAAGSLTLTVSGSVTKGQLNLGSTALPYQRNDANLGGVATGASTDLHWLETDGVDDGMVTGNIDLTGTDKVSVFAGLRKLSDAPAGVMLELSASITSNNGSFALFAPRSASNYGFSLRGTAIASRNATTYTAPISNVLSYNFDIAQSTRELEILPRVDGVIPTLTGADGVDAGTGNYGNYPLYLFRRGGTLLPFNGWFYGLAITGRLATDAETVATERYLAAKASVVIP